MSYHDEMFPQESSGVDETSDLRKRVAELEQQLAVAKSFHDVAVKERDYERTRYDGLEAERDRLRDAGNRVVTAWDHDDEHTADSFDDVVNSLRKALAETEDNKSFGRRTSELAAQDMRLKKDAEDNQ